MKDTIYRKDAIDAVYKCTDIFVGNLPVMVDKADAYKALAKLPSAQPERKGKWIPHTLPHGGISFDFDTCSECGEQFSDAWRYNFCPNCGACMCEKEV